MICVQRVLWHQRCAFVRFEVCRLYDMRWYDMKWNGMQSTMRDSDREVSTTTTVATTEKNQTLQSIDKCYELSKQHHTMPIRTGAFEELCFLVFVCFLIAKKPSHQLNAMSMTNILTRFECLSIGFRWYFAIRRNEKRARERLHGLNIWFDHAEIYKISNDEKMLKITSPSYPKFNRTRTKNAIGNRQLEQHIFTGFMSNIHLHNRQICRHLFALYFAIRYTDSISSHLSNDNTNRQFSSV